jgi:hypothetical protein
MAQRTRRSGSSPKILRHRHGFDHRLGLVHRFLELSFHAKEMARLIGESSNGDVANFPEAEH